MASKQDRFYFENFIEAAECSGNAAKYLIDCLKDYNPEKLNDMLESMHEIEHGADEKKHEMSMALAKAFVTPLDREDLASLSQCIDEVTDKIEEVLQHFYISGIKTILPEAVEFAGMIHNCCELMRDMLREMENFKRPDRLHKLIIDLNHKEEECDRFYLTIAAGLRGRLTDPYEVFAWREIFDYMEDCADACEHVADMVDTIVMKNT